LAKQLKKKTFTNTDPL